jgi:hypothetical protein
MIFSSEKRSNLCNYLHFLRFEGKAGYPRCRYFSGQILISRPLIVAWKESGEKDARAREQPLGYRLKLPFFRYIRVRRFEAPGFSIGVEVEKASL